MLAWRKSLGKYGLVKSDCEIPMIKDDEVLVKVLATGIYGTDFGIYKGYREVEEGLIPGHEFIGEIVKLGSSVTGYEVGQDMDLKTGASIEPVAVAYSAVKKVLQFISGKDVLIYGPGAIGLYTAQIARIAGAGKILMAGTAADQDRLELARKNYNVEIVNVDKEDVDERMKGCFKYGKADIIFEATGVAAIIGKMLPQLRPHGELILVGVYHDNSEMNLLPAGRGELSIRGTFCYTLSEFEYAIRLVEAGKINFDGIVDTVDLDHLDEGFEKTMSKESIKIVAYSKE